MAGVGVKTERSSRTIVGVGLALLGAAQAVNRVSKIRINQVFIFISLISDKALIIINKLLDQVQQKPQSTDESRPAEQTQAA